MGRRIDTLHIAGLSSSAQRTDKANSGIERPMFEMSKVAVGLDFETSGAFALAGEIALKTWRGTG